MFNTQSTPGSDSLHPTTSATGAFLSVPSMSSPSSSSHPSPASSAPSSPPQSPRLPFHQRHGRLRSLQFLAFRLSSSPPLTSPQNSTHSPHLHRQHRHHSRSASSSQIKSTTTTTSSTGLTGTTLTASSGSTTSPALQGTSHTLSASAASAASTSAPGSATPTASSSNQPAAASDTRPVGGPVATPATISAATIDAHSPRDPNNNLTERSPNGRALVLNDSPDLGPDLTRTNSASTPPLPVSAPAPAVAAPLVTPTPSDSLSTFPSSATASFFSSFSSRSTPESRRRRRRTFSTPALDLIPSHDPRSSVLAGAHPADPTRDPAGPQPSSTDSVQHVARLSRRQHFLRHGLSRTLTLEGDSRHSRYRNFPPTGEEIYSPVLPVGTTVLVGTGLSRRTVAPPRDNNSREQDLYCPILPTGTTVLVGTPLSTRAEVPLLDTASSDPQGPEGSRPRPRPASTPVPFFSPPTALPDPVDTMARTRSASRAAATVDEAPPTEPGATPVLPSIRFSTYLDPRSHRPSLTFSPVARTLPTGGEVIRVGRYSERDGHPPVPNGIPSAAPVGFKSKVVSRRHCEFWYDNNHWYIKDVKSSSGTFLNHIRLSPPGTESKPFPVNDGDIVQLGIDFKGGEEMIFRCVKMRLELNRNWQNKLNPFNLATHTRLRNMVNADSASTYSQDCSICLNSIAPCQTLFVAPCSHTWHYKCIRTLLSTPQYPIFVCPNCRATTDLEMDPEEPDNSHLEEWRKYHGPSSVAAADDAAAPGSAQGQSSANGDGPSPAPVSTLAQTQTPAPEASPAVPTQQQPAQLPGTDQPAPNGPNQSVQSDDEDLEMTPPSMQGQDPDTTIASAPGLPPATSPMTIPNGGGTRGHSGARTPEDGQPMENGQEGPITPRNDAGPWVFDGSAARNRTSPVRHSEGGVTIDGAMDVPVE